MKLNSWMLCVALLLPAAGCAVGLPHGPLEPSVTADCVNYLNNNWLTAVNGGAVHCEADSDEPTACPPIAPARCETCRDCPLIPNAGPAPVYVDPGPPGRFLPVPVRPAFAPQPTGYLQTAPMGW